MPAFCRSVCVLSLMIALVVSRTSSAAVLPEEPLTLEAAVALAVRQNPAITRAQQEARAAAAGLDVARTTRRPELQVTVRGMYNPSPTSITFEDAEITLGSRFSSGADLSLAQPIWPPERWRAPISNAEAGVGISVAALERTRQQVIFQTQQAFFHLLSAQELLLVAEDAAQVAHTQLRLAESTVAVGLAAPLDVYQAQASLADTELSVERARSAVKLATAGLALHLGLPAGTPLVIAPVAEMPAVPETVEPLVARALAIRPEVAQLRYRQQQARATLALIRLQKRPLVNVQANYNTDILGGNPLAGGGATLSAVAAMNLYNGGRTAAEVRVAEEQLAQLDTLAEQYALGITLEVHQAWLALLTSGEQLAAARRQQTAADEALRIARVRYEHGEGIVLEVEQASLRRTQALTALAQARFHAHQAAAELEYAIGGVHAPVHAEAP